MLALTIWQPYASLIVGSPNTPPQKPIENRGWRPPRSAIGQRIAIHAGKKMDRETLELYHDIFIAKSMGPVVAPYAKPRLFPLGAVIGVATLDRVIGPIDGSMFYDDRLNDVPSATIDSWGLDADGLRWFVSGFGWVFCSRCRIEPVQCDGKQGLWQLPMDVERSVLDRVPA